MDAERQIRFLYPPIFLLASLGLGIFIDDSFPLDRLLPASGSTSDAVNVVAILGAGGVATLSLGFFIGSVTYVLARVATWCLNRTSHESLLPDATYTQLEEVVGFHGERADQDKLFLSATFDHHHLPSGVHQWLVRRWNAFNLNGSIVSALLLSLAVGPALGVRPSKEWTLIVVPAALMFCGLAYMAWSDTMGMIAFQARLASEQKRHAAATELHV